MACSLLVLIEHKVYFHFIVGENPPPARREIWIDKWLCEKVMCAGVTGFVDLMENNLTG